MRSPKLLLSALALTLSLACTPVGGDDDAGLADDAGATDGGPDAGPIDDDAGSTDAGEEPCELDPTLGSLELADGFRVASSGPLPGNIVAVAAVESGATYRVYGVDGVALEVLDLGAWPTLGESSPAFSLLPADAAPDEAYASPFLSSDGTSVTGGYTGRFELGLAPGKVARWEAGAGDDVVYVDAPNNLTGAYVGDALLVSAAGLDDLNGAGVYALVDDGASRFATYDDEWEAFGGVTTATRDGAVFLSAWFAAGDEGPVDHVFALSADEATAALAGEPVDLGQVDEVGAWPMLDGAAFGDGFAFISGDGFGVPIDGLRYVEGLPGAAPVDVLRVVDECTRIELVDTFDGDLLVGVRDASGSRLLHVRTDG